jgi:RND family efflux transporter MFP subunit
VDFAGRTDSAQAVDVRARVTGYLVRRHFKDGSDVQTGDLLFEIDPRPYRAQLDQAISQVKLNDASLKLARTNYEMDKAVAMKQPGAVSTQQLAADRAAVDEAVARVKAAESSTEVYKLNICFTNITAPISGQISRTYLTEGNLVIQDQTLLTTIVSLDPIMYVYFDLDEPTLIRIRKAVNEGKLRPLRDGAMPVSMGLQGEEGHPHEGTINFVNNQVNPTTGSITMRGVFANPKPPGREPLFSPGMFVRIRLPIGRPYPALLVIDRAIGSDQGLKYVYVLDADNKVEHRRVSTGALQPDGLRVITEGLQPDDWVVVGGLPQIRPRQEVRPDHITMPTLVGPSGASAAGARSEQIEAASHPTKQGAVTEEDRPREPNGAALQAPLAWRGRCRSPRGADLRKPAILSNFFIDRPIFATVLSVVITLIGGLALVTLPLAQYPHITPPGVSISISYPGASAQVVADTVAAPIKQQVNGVPGMIYMSSQCGNDGSYTLTVTFDIGTDLKTALVMVQNRVTLALPQLPTEVQNQGITIRKRTPDLLMIVNLFSPDGRYNDIYLSNYATINLKDELLRVPGVSDITYQGQRDYSIRAWLDADKMAALNLTAPDVAQAIRSQNLDAPAGQTSRPPAPDTQSFQQPILTLGRLNSIEQFGDIIVKVGQPRPDASSVTKMTPPRRAGTSSANSLTAARTLRRTGAGNTTTASATTNATIMDAITSVAIASGTTTSTAPLAGGGTTGGAATTSDASTGAGSSGGGTTGGGATSGSSLTSGTIPGLSINSTGATSVAGVGSGGALSGETMGRGPGRADAAIVLLRDIARMELGAQNYNQACLFDGRPAVGLGLYQLPGTNALEVADNVRRKMEELKTRFPDGVDYAIGYDTTPYIRESIRGVLYTLLEAVLLVGVVVLLFLQDWRAMILPMIDIPVSIIGTFAIMALMDFSLNNISLFGLVLAIGIVVDDAIVVLENIERMIARGYEPRTATIKAMEEVTGPIVAVGLVLCAVFVPCAFISGITGQFFRQFALTISVSTVISAINAITMTPSRAVFLFKNEPAPSPLPSPPGGEGTIVFGTAVAG